MEVTERGRLVALLVPPGPAQSARDRLIASGELLPAAEPLRLPRRPRATSTTAEALEEIRADRS